MIDTRKYDLWMHVHVSKCGGSTLWHVLSGNFEAVYYSGQTLMDQLIYSKDQAETILNSNAWLGFYSDHKLSLDLHFESEHFNINVICF